MSERAAMSESILVTGSSRGPIVRASVARHSPQDGERAHG